MSSQKVNVAEYLFTRLYQLGVKDLHGVPGDFNLVALDYVEPCGINWVGNCNELNAGRSALASLCRMTELSQGMQPTRTVD
jgi:pyruvate decarboxylase